MSRRMGSGVSVIGLSTAPVGSVVWCREQSAPVVTVVCRATFMLHPGQAVLAKEQEPLTAVEMPYPDGTSQGLYAPADLVPMKPRAGVVLVGHAFAPGGQPARSLFARLAVGAMDKRIEVFCDRHFDLEGSLCDGRRFTSMPLVYERAAGGAETLNPLGVRSDQRNSYGRIVLPNLQPPGLEITSASDFIAPIGFGPIANTWPQRRALLGPNPNAEPPAGSEQILPRDLDPAHFHAAPRDQQVEELRDDESILLENLHPQHSVLSTRLPGIRPRTFVEGRGAPQAVAMRADTLWIDSSRAICTMTWRGQIRLENPDESLRALVAMEEPGRALTWGHLERLRDNARVAAPKSPMQTLNLAPGRGAALARSPLPFIEAQRPQPPREPVGDGGLPFRSASAPAASPMPAPPRPSWGASESLEREPPRSSSASPPMEPPPPPSAPAPAVGSALADPWARDPRGGAPPPSSQPVVPAPPLAARPLTPTPTPVNIARPPPDIVIPSPQPRPASPAVRATAPSPLNLVWFNPGCLPGLRRDSRFSPLLDALEGQPLDEDLDDPTQSDDAADLEDRREVFEILARGAPGAEDLTSALNAATRDDGRLVPPTVLVAGELVFPFDELELLKATLSAAAPHAGADLEAKGILALTKTFLGTPGLPGASVIAEGLAARIRDTFEKSGLLPAGYIDAQTERALLGGRRFQRRLLLGGPHVRALFHLETREDPIPTYLGPELAAKLPAASRFRVRLLARLLPAADENETHPRALHALALGIVSPRWCAAEGLEENSSMPDMLELVFIDPKSPARIRRRPPWREVLDDARKSLEAALPADPEPTDESIPPGDRDDVFLILARAAETDSTGVSMALSDAVRGDGKFAPPLVLVAGELRFPFDELETLKSAITAATPFTGGDEPLKAAVDAANDFLQTPDLLASPAVIEAVTDRVRQAFGRGRRTVPAGYLDAQIERSLLEHRRYQKRVFEGKPHLRVLLHPPGDKSPMLVYLPADLDVKLPLYQRFPARLIAAATVSTDAFETHSFALQALALARQVPISTPRR